MSCDVDAVKAYELANAFLWFVVLILGVMFAVSPGGTDRPPPRP